MFSHVSVSLSTGMGWGSIQGPPPHHIVGFHTVTPTTTGSILGPPPHSRAQYHMGPCPSPHHTVGLHKGHAPPPITKSGDPYTRPTIQVVHMGPCTQPIKCGLHIPSPPPRNTELSVSNATGSTPLAVTLEDCLVH